jgi:hypothetical protein
MYCISASMCLLLCQQSLKYLQQERGMLIQQTGILCERFVMLLKLSMNTAQIVFDVPDVAYGS